MYRNNRSTYHKNSRYNDDYNDNRNNRNDRNEYN